MLGNRQNMTADSQKKFSLENETWDMVIQPQRSLFDLRLGELWHYRDLVMLFVRRDFVATYKQTILGPLWYLIQPLLTTITFTFIFGNIANLPTDGLPQFLFYMSGTVVWSYFAACITKTSETFVQNAHLFGKVYFPRMAVPVSILVSNLITFLIQFAMFLVFIGFFAARGTSIQLNWLWIALSPVLVLMMAGLGLGLWHHHLLADHQVPRPALSRTVRCAIADVCHTGDLPGFLHSGKLSMAHPSQPDDIHRGGLSLRVFGRGDGESCSIAL